MKRREEDALAYAYDSYSAALYGIIVRIVRHDGTSEEILQQTFLKIWNNISTYSESQGTLFTWMATIARNSAIDKVRVKTFQNEQKTDSFDPTVNDSESQSNVAADIDANILVNLLDDKYKEIVDLIYLKGYSHSETAKLLSLPVGTVKTRLRFALNLLRKKLKNEKGLFFSLLFILLMIIIIIL